MTDDGHAAYPPHLVIGQVFAALALGTFGFGEIVLLTHDVMFRQSTGGQAKLVQLIEMLRNANFEFDFISNYRGSNVGDPYRRIPIM